VIGIAFAVIIFSFIAVYLLYRYYLHLQAESKADGYNGDFNDVNTSPNIFSFIDSNAPSPRRKSATPHFGEQYATGIFNDQGKLRTEENPTNARLTLSMNQSRKSNFIDDRSVEAGLAGELRN